MTTRASNSSIRIARVTRKARAEPLARPLCCPELAPQEREYMGLPGQFLYTVLDVSVRCECTQAQIITGRLRVS